MILMSHLLYIAYHPAISDQFLLQILRLTLPLMRPRIQAGDRLHQHFASPNGGDKWFPMYHCTALQLDQNSVNKNSLNVQLFQDNKKTVKELINVNFLF